MDKAKHEVFMETRESIYREAEAIAKLKGVPALVDTLLQWADEAMHGQIFRDLADEATTARYSITGIGIITAVHTS